MHRWLYVSGLTLMSVACTASGGGLDGLTFGSSDLPGAGTESDDDTDGMQQLSAGDDSESTTDDDPTGDDPSTTGEDPDDPTDPTGDDPTDPTGVGGSTGGPVGECMPGQTESCYDGPAGTLGVGQCVAGTRTCQGDETWGACTGAVEPATEVCGNGLDEDCNASADDGCTTATACNPMAPALACAAGEHCFPSATGDTTCEGPTGLGTQYTLCSSDADCTADHACIGVDQTVAYCMQWCTNTLQCPLLLDACTGLTPAVYAGLVEHGVCYDGLG